MKEPMIKRLFDIFLSSVGLVCSSPLWILFSLAIWLEDRGPLFYTQDRVGKNGRVFNALKFRSMIPDAEKHTGAVWATEHDPRVTRVGRILRATAMDELPQLWNIILWM
jgi:lipopolysaccharide/colanic/teichoic acid biosynthesis glycosyltransferase